MKKRKIQLFEIYSSDRKCLSFVKRENIKSTERKIKEGNKEGNKNERERKRERKMNEKESGK